MYPPLQKYGISSPYGQRAGGFHRGVDIPCPTGTDIPTPMDGTIAFEGRIKAAAPGYPDEIICIIQGSGQFIVMGHLSATIVNNGQKVKKGQIVARSGNTGFSTGPHLHIELATGTKDPRKGILAYSSKDITPMLKSYGQSTSTAKDDLFKNCFITQAHRWPNATELSAWQKSAMAPYTWVQRNAPNPEVTKRDKQITQLKADIAKLKAAPPVIKEVIKEVEVVKEVPVEIVKEVRVPMENIAPLELIRMAINGWLKGGE